MILFEGTNFDYIFVLMDSSTLKQLYKGVSQDNCPVTMPVWAMINFFCEFVET